MGALSTTEMGTYPKSEYELFVMRFLPLKDINEGKFRDILGYLLSHTPQLSTHKHRLDELWSDISKRICYADGDAAASFLGMLPLDEKQRRIINRCEL